VVVAVERVRVLGGKGGTDVPVDVSDHANCLAQLLEHFLSLVTLGLHRMELLLQCLSHTHPTQLLHSSATFSAADAAATRHATPRHATSRSQRT
jgi:hypothetical protein